MTSAPAHVPVPANRSRPLPRVRSSTRTCPSRASSARPSIAPSTGALSAPVRVPATTRAARGRDRGGRLPLRRGRSRPRQGASPCRSRTGAAPRRRVAAPRCDRRALAEPGDARDRARQRDPGALGFIVVDEVVALRPHPRARESGAPVLLDVAATAVDVAPSPRRESSATLERVVQREHPVEHSCVARPVPAHDARRSERDRPRPPAAESTTSAAHGRMCALCWQN